MKVGARDKGAHHERGTTSALKLSHKDTTPRKAPVLHAWQSMPVVRTRGGRLWQEP
jgi:hypothetical protein